MEWDDLRYILAVHRGESVAAAARTLGVSNVTVFRRIESIEKALGVRLFDRMKQGYVATVAAAEIVEQAGRIEGQIRDLESRVWRHDSQVRGSVRVTTMDSFGAVLLPVLVTRLHDTHPDLRIELVIDPGFLSITRREADIALRATPAPPENLVGHRLGPLRSAAYASKSFVARRLRKQRNLAAVPWGGAGPRLPGLPQQANQWIKANGYAPQVILTTNSFLGMALAVKSGAGVGIMSSVLAGAIGGLVAVTPQIKELDRDMWILIHPDLREVARVAAVYSFLRTELGSIFAKPAATD